MNIAIIIGTTRQGRVSPRLASWVSQKFSKSFPDININLLDLKDYRIPMLDQAPWQADRKLTDGAKKWLEDLDTADGYVFVTAEYNHSFPAVLKNALDYTNGQLKRKPALIISHGVNHGVRANEALRMVLNSTLGTVPVPASGTFFGNVVDILDENGGELQDNSMNSDKIHAGIEELIWYLKALKAARVNE